MKRREFIKTAGAGILLAASGAALGPNAQAATLPPVSESSLPRWRGFNLLEKFIQRKGGNPAYRESDFELIGEWGFNFVRLPMSYLCWASGDPKEWLKIREAEILHVDEAIEFGRKHGIHVNLNFHRIPGYCVNPPPEPLDLWKDEEALEAAAHHWAWFAKRYRGIPNERVTFDLINEPADVPESTYVKVVERLVRAIRAEDPQRVIIADGLRWGTVPVPGLVRLGVGQSTRGYDPSRVSHYKANWVKGSDTWPVPTWPLVEAGKPDWNKDRLRKERIQPWRDLQAKGVGVHVGEWGAHQFTPHAVVLAWMKDQLELWQEAGWGWALWNLRGNFGVLDSGRTDVDYESFRGMKLDRKMIDLLRAH